MRCAAASPSIQRSASRLYVAWGAVVALAGMPTSGCTSVNHYATPRVLPRGETSVSGAVEAGQVTRSNGAPSFPNAKATSRSLALYPTLRVRRGVHERVELGATIHPSGPGGELKVALASKGDDAWLTLLVAPALLAGTFIVDAPLLARVAVHERVDLVVSPGLAVAAPVLDNRLLPNGFFARGGLGASLSLGRGLRVMPEITLASAIVGRTPLWATGGIAFSGQLPDPKLP